MARGGSGYTIVETMIFLAVTAVIFAGAISVVGGKQEIVQFTQATRDAQSNLANVINQVSSGYYPNKGGFTCTVSGGAGPSFNSIPSPQGSSTDCVFLGKAVKFNTGSDAEKFQVISMAARRVTTTGKEVGNLTEAVPMPIAGGGGPDVTETLTFGSGVSVTRIVAPSSPGASYGTILFISTLPKFQASTETLASGTQRVLYGAVSGSSLTDSYSDALARLSGLSDAALVQNPSSGIYICLADDTDVAKAKQKAMLVVGEGASQTSVRLETGNYSTTICEG